MARPPITEEELIARYGPHLNEAPPGGWDAGPRGRPGRQDPLLLLRPAVRHQAEGPRQRGRRLRAVVRVPVQRGQALPEGREALPPGQPPRPAAAPDGARPVGARAGSATVSWDEALDRVVGEIRRIQADLRRRRLRHVVGRVADQREELPDRQVRPARAAHRQPRLQRPLLHGVGRRRQQEGARHRPGAEPVERHPARRRGVGRRLERRRDVPDHDELHLAGPRPRRQAHRAGPAGRAAGPHRRPVPAGPAGHRLGAVRRGAARADPPRLARPRVHRRPHPRLRRGRRGRRRHDAGSGRPTSPACRRRASSRRPSGGARRRPGCCCTPAASSSRPRASTTCSPRSTSGWPPASSASRAAACRRSPGRATARAAASTATSATSSPATATSPTPSTAPHVAAVWGCDESRDPRQGHHRPRRSSRRSTTARSRGCCRSASTRRCRRPTPNFTAEALDKLEFYAVIDFFLSESGAPRRRRAARLAARGGRGHLDQRRGPDHQDQRRRRRRRARPGCDWEILLDLAERLGKGEYFPYTNTERDLRGAAPGLGRRHRRLPRRHLGADRGRDGPVLADPRGRPPRHAPPVRGRHVLPPRRQGPLPRACRYQRAGRGRRRRLPGVAHHRPGRQPVPVGHPDPAHRRARRRSTPSRCARCTRSSPTRSASPTATWSPSRRGAATITLPAARRHHDPARHRVHPVPLARRARRPTSSPTGPSTRCRRCPSSRSPPCASNAPAGGADTDRRPRPRAPRGVDR